MQNSTHQGEYTFGERLSMCHTVLPFSLAVIPWAMWTHLNMKEKCVGTKVSHTNSRSGN